MSTTKRSARLPEKMKGILFVAKGQAAIQEEAVPACRPGQVLCKTVYTGVTNGTERNALMGGNYCGGWPGRCGYQNVGHVLKVGEGVSGFETGDIVFSGDFCQHAEYFAAPAGPESLIVKLPSVVDPKYAALFGVASVAMHDVRRANTKIGDNVLVVGAGPIGQFTAQAARVAGARVTVTDLNAKRLAVAARCGAHRTIPIVGDETWAGPLRQAGPFDEVFEDSGGPVLDKIIGPTWGQGILKHRSTVVIIAGRQEVTYSFNAGQGYELTIVHASHFVRSDLEEVCRLTAEGAIRVKPVVQDIVPFDKAVSVYDRLRDDPASLFGTVFVY